MTNLELRVLNLERQLERLQMRSRSAFAAARSTMAAKDDGAVQKVQLRLDALSVRDDVPVLYHHGFFSSPPAGSDYHVCFLDNDASQAVVVATNNQQTRFTGAATGDAGLYAHGHLFHLTAGGILMTGDVTHTGDVAQTGDLTLTGNQTINGDLHVTGAVIAGFGGGDQVSLQTHKHASDNTPPTPGT